MNQEFRTAGLRLAAILLALWIGNSSNTRATDDAPFEGEKTAWHDGFDRFDYLMDEKTLTIEPFKRDANERFGVKAPPKGKRRLDRGRPQKAGARQTVVLAGLLLGPRAPGRSRTAAQGLSHRVHHARPRQNVGCLVQAYLTEKHGLSKKPAFIGMSKGGVNEYDWASANPDKVSCIYADNPAIRPGAFEKLDLLARRDVPLLNICGSLDFLLTRHTLANESRYHQLGGRITVMIKEGAAHHPHSLKNPKPIADWIEKNVAPAADRPDFADPTFTKSSYYSFADSYSKLTEEKTYAVCRGPGFAECYDRYGATTKSQWGITGMTVIVPKSAAAGKPWVFRADRLDPDAAAVDLALLAKGFHIVMAPLVAQSGPVREQWDAVYKLLTKHGFSSKPVMEGAGPAAGEAYAWAIENPDKVSCIYGENPALRSLMSKVPPIDNLAALAKAGVPLIHVCGSRDPWLDDQTRVVEKRYKSLGGQIAVIVKEGEGHHPLGPKDPNLIADLIGKLVH